jgi:hypothetical protein
VGIYIQDGQIQEDHEVQGLACGIWESVTEIRFTNLSDDSCNDFALSPTYDYSQVRFEDVIARCTQYIYLY